VQIKPLNFKAKLISRENITSDIFSIKFKKPSNFKFLPGQYVKVFLDIKNPDLRGVTRYFTIASSPTESEIMITTRIVRSAFKKELQNLKVGKDVKMKGPWGTLVWEDSDLRPIVYLSAGTGITPARSMLVYLRDKNIKIPFTLIVSFRPGEKLFDAELTEMENDTRKIYYHESDAGRIDKKIIGKIVTNLAKTRFMISGPVSFVTDMRKMLAKLGAIDENIEYEDFSGYK